MNAVGFRSIRLPHRASMMYSHNQLRRRPLEMPRPLQALWLTFTMLPPLVAQDSRGRILGRVVDSSSAVVAGAQVTATQVEMNVHLTAKTNDAGNYDLQ